MENRINMCVYLLGDNEAKIEAEAIIKRLLASVSPSTTFRATAVFNAAQHTYIHTLLHRNLQLESSTFLLSLVK